MDSKLGTQSVSSTWNPTSSGSDVGKWRRLSRLSDENGRFAMIAVDQRTSLKRMLDLSEVEAERRALQAVKRTVAQFIAPLATAILTDPIYGYPASLGAIPSGTGLMLAVEVSGYETAGDAERRSRLLEDFRVGDVSTAGADGAKLLIWHHPDASAETQEHQRGIVRRVGAACRKIGLPFILEIVPYGLSASKNSPEHLRRKPELVLDGVRTYSAPEYGVDLFKVPFPADLKYTDSYQGTPYAKGSVLFERSEVEAVCRELNEAASAPWVILSAGVDPDEFIENVRIANAAGASGFLCGRAVWKKVVQHVPNEQEMARFMEEYGCVQFRRLREANAGAHSWYDRTSLSVRPEPATIH